jgi:uncharacterized protein (DUF2147 family)
LQPRAGGNARTNNGESMLEMTMLKRAIPMVFAMSMATTVSAATAGEATGTWMMASGKVTVRVTNCGNSLCGYVVALKKPLDKRGRPKVDKENPNPALRNRPVIGLSLLSGMKPAGPDKWTGLIYNPDDGHTYNAKVTVNGNTMKVKGCVVGFLCQSKIFVRID